MQPIRILHENVIMDPGGIETQLMRIYKNIDREKIQFDFLLHRREKGQFDDEIRAMGGRIYYAERFDPFHFVSYVRSMRRFFAVHTEYQIMIAHAELALWPLIEAKRANIPMRICYSHNGRFTCGIKRVFMDVERLFLKNYCTDMFAVSALAGSYTFGEHAVCHGDVRLVKNGIQIEQFAFDGAVRDQKRRELGCENGFVVGHVGRFMRQKNHTFLLDIFCELLRRNPQAELWLVGEGHLQTDIWQKIEKIGIQAHVRLLGRRMDVPALMQAMDCLVLPSLWEGFPNVAIEAQAAALPLYLSTSITEEAAFTPYASRLELADGAAAWADVIDRNRRHPMGRRDTSGVLARKGFDVRATAKWYETFYLSAVGAHGKEHTDAENG